MSPRNELEGRRASCPTCGRMWETDERGWMLPHTTQALTISGHVRTVQCWGGRRRG